MTRHQLGLRLRLDETRPAAIATIAAAFRRAPKLPDCARELGVPLRTLNNWIRDVEGVAEAIEEVRCEAPRPPPPREISPHDPH